MKSATVRILLLIHVLAFALLFAGKLAPGAAGNVVVSLGLVVEFPGWFIGTILFRHSGQAAVLGFTFVANALLYFAGGLMVDSATGHT